MSKIDNGGPAFPSKRFAIDHEEWRDELGYHPVEGMSLRDYFAANALPIAQKQMEEWAVTQGKNGGNLELLAEAMMSKTAGMAYEYADAMIAEKRRTEVPNG